MFLLSELRLVLKREVSRLKGDDSLSGSTVSTAPLEPALVMLRRRDMPRGRKWNDEERIGGEWIDDMDRLLSAFRMLFSWIGAFCDDPRLMERWTAERSSECCDGTDGIAVTATGRLASGAGACAVGKGLFSVICGSGENSRTTSGVPVDMLLMLVRLFEPRTDGEIVTDFNDGVFGKSISNGVTGLDILTGLDAALVLMEIGSGGGL